MGRPISYYKIRVIKFDKHNEKVAGKASTWLRLSSGLTSSSKYKCLSSGAKHFWIHLLCEASKSSTRIVHVHPRDVPSVAHVRARALPGMISELTEIEWIQVLDAPASRARATNERTNERTNDTSYEVKEKVEKQVPEIQQELVPSEPPASPPTRSSKKVSTDLQKELGQKTALVVAAYCRAYKLVHKTNPILTKKDLGILQRLLGKPDAWVIPVERLCTMVQVYCQMQDPYFVKRKHDLTTFEQNISKVHVAHETGIDGDRKEDPFSFFDEKRNAKAVEMQS
jgi:hypothetical protein